MDASLELKTDVRHPVYLSFSFADKTNIRWLILQWHTISVLLNWLQKTVLETKTVFGFCCVVWFCCCLFSDKTILGDWFYGSGWFLFHETGCRKPQTMHETWTVFRFCKYLAYAFQYRRLWWTILHKLLICKSYIYDVFSSSDDIVLGPVFSMVFSFKLGRQASFSMDLGTLQCLQSFVLLDVTFSSSLSSCHLCDVFMWRFGCGYF